MCNKVLIAGGAGFIGSNLSERLINSGYCVHILDDETTGSFKNVEHLEMIKKYIGSIESARDLECEYDIIINLASPASPKDFGTLYNKILISGSEGVRNLLSLCSDHTHFIHMSTSEVYGDPLVHPQHELYFGNVNSFGPRSCYNESKRFAEALIYSYEKDFPLRNASIIRLFNTYGPKMRIDDGRVVSSFIYNAISGLPLDVYGNGLQTRSLCYIDDVLNAIEKVIEIKPKGPINIGNPNFEISISDLAKKVIEITNSKSEIKYTKSTIDDPKIRKPDISRAQNVLQWNPVISLDEGLTKYHKWIHNNA